MTNPYWIHGHASVAGDTLWHVADKALWSTLCGKPILALARGLMDATCPECRRVALEAQARHGNYKERVKK